ncbi:triosephosphate isomerase [Clostridiales bacterium PH28_bin88]|nr:triosephosphate isomerase [Clostridiales bacterium PH28_bin88]
MRKPVIAGNWKMYKTPSEARDLVEALKPLLAGQNNVEAVVCPPFTALETVNNLLQGTNIGLGAQDVYWEKEGAFTGEVSPDMLAAAGCRYVIIGHSERRQYFGETDETVNKKVKAAIAAGLIPIVCVGETLAQREVGETEQVCRTQVQGGLAGLSAPQVAAMVIAYEPVWAIGTGRTASAADAQEVIAGIRGVVAGMYGKEAADSLRIQYGGSVKPENIAELMAQPDIDGALVGGASLKAESFAKIVKYK